MRPLLQIVLLAFALSLAADARAQSTWDVAHAPFVDQTLQDIHFHDGQRGWAVGNAGTLMRTTDTGSTWQSISPGDIEPNLMRVEFIDANVGFVGAADGTIMRTDDGGMSWHFYYLAELLPHVDINQFRDMSFVDAETGWVVLGRARQSYVLKTEDGGETWAVQDSLADGTNQNWIAIDFYDANRGVIAGDQQGTHRYTADGGETWLVSELEDQFFRKQNQIVWLDENTVVSVGEGLEFQMLPTPIYRSTDGGATWTKATQEGDFPYDRLRDVYFKDDQNGVAVGSNGFSRQFISRTDDGGQTWTTSMAPFSSGLQSIAGVGDTLVALASSSHFVRSFDFGESWELVPLKTPTSIAAVTFVEGTGYLVSRSGMVFKNADGTGLAWDYVGETGIWDAQSMVFTDAETGFVLKDNRRIVRTTDGGATWETVLETLPFSSQNRSMSIVAPSVDVLYVWVSENNYREYYVYKSEDGGDSWDQVDHVSADATIGGTMTFFTEDVGMILGPDLWVHRTTDGGATWNDDAVLEGFPDGFETKDFRDVAVIDESVAWAVGQQFIVRTDDSGATWTWVDHGVADIDSNFYAIEFDDAGRGFIGSFDGTVIFTDDGGSTWSVDTSMQGDYIVFTSGITPGGDWLLGTSNGYLLRSDVSGVSAEEGVLPQPFRLDQNYPNPFNRQTTIGFTVDQPGAVELVVYDLAGRAVTRLVDGVLPAGRHSIEFDGQGLSSGIYVYQLRTESSVQRRAMVLVR